MPTIYNVDLAERGREYAQALPPTLYKITMQLRGNFVMRFAFDAGGTAAAGTYMTVKAGSVYWEEDLTFGAPWLPANPLPITLYLSCPDADDQVVEIVVWP